MSAIANQERLMGVLLGPHLSEKSTRVGEIANQVVFRVRTDSTKQEVRRAVELLFEVQVVLHAGLIKQNDCLLMDNF